MSTTRPELMRRRGFALMSAIFLLVVLGALGGFIAVISTTQSAGATLDVLGAQVYQSARAGSEWALYHAKSGGNCAGDFDVQGIHVTVQCVTTPVDEASPAPVPNFYSITVTACNLPAAGTCPGNAAAPNYVERKVEVLAEM